LSGKTGLYKYEGSKSIIQPQYKQFETSWGILQKICLLKFFFALLIFQGFISQSMNNHTVYAR